MRKIMFLLNLLVSLMLLSAGAHAEEKSAQPPATPDIKTESKKTQDPVGQEVASLKSRIIELQNNSKLGFNKIVTCKSVDGFGIYAPLEISQPANKLIFYVEPSNYSTLQSADRYIIDCSVDFHVLDASGKPVLSNDNALKINRVSRSPIMDLYFKIEMNLKTTRKPEIIFVRIVLHDKIKNQSTTANLKVKMEGGKSKPDEQI